MKLRHIVYLRYLRTRKTKLYTVLVNWEEWTIMINSRKIKTHKTNFLGKKYLFKNQDNYNHQNNTMYSDEQKCNKLWKIRGVLNTCPDEKTCIIHFAY